MSSKRPREFPYFYIGEALQKDPVITTESNNKNLKNYGTPAEVKA